MSGPPKPPPIPPIPSDLLFLTTTVVDAPRSPSPVAPGACSPPPLSPDQNPQGRHAKPDSSPHPTRSPSPPSRGKQAGSVAPPASPAREAPPAFSSPVATSTPDGDTQDSSPYKGRRSFKSTPPPSQIDKAARQAHQVEISAAVLDPSPAQKPNPGVEAPIPKSFVPSLGAWAKPLAIPKPLQDPSIVITMEVDKPKPNPEILPPEVKENGQLRFPWAARMDPSVRNLHRTTSPTYMEDGTPKVHIPNHVLMQGLENQKEYIIGQFFRCKTPSGGLVHAMANRIWGNKCKISSRKFSDSSYLFHIPDAPTRAWVLQRGLWHIDDCLMFVAPWTLEASLALPEITTMPVWVTLKNIPSRLYSRKGISWVASALGEPMLTNKPWLDPTLMGEAKVMVEMELEKPFPEMILAEDERGNVALVDVQYSWIPSKCKRCGQLGHKESRCLLHSPEPNISKPSSVVDSAVRVAVISKVVAATDSMTSVSEASNVAATVASNAAAPAASNAAAPAASNAAAPAASNTAATDASNVAAAAAQRSLSSYEPLPSSNAVAETVSSSVVAITSAPSTTDFAENSEALSLPTSTSVEVDQRIPPIASIKAVSTETTATTSGLSNVAPSTMEKTLSSGFPSHAVNGKTLSPQGSLENETLQEKVLGSNFAAFGDGVFTDNEMGDSSINKTRGGRLIKPTQKVQEMEWTIARDRRKRGGRGGRGGRGIPC